MNFYNEIDPKGAQWIRNLIKAGEIPEGVVDERSIVDIEPEYLDQFTQCHFFAGIGGWAYALRLADWPGDRPVWTGSCPCQPFSVAGAGGGLTDERHLWPAFRWLISQCRPAVVFGEQVASADGRNWMSGVRDDLEVMGYDVGAADLCAAGVGAPHIRQRLFWGAGRVAENPASFGRGRGRDGDSGRSGRKIQTSGLGAHSDRLADGGQQGPQGQCRDVGDGNKSGRVGAVETGSVAASGEPVEWSRSVWWPCRDGKLRRVPARWVGNAQGDDERRDPLPGCDRERVEVGGSGRDIAARWMGDQPGGGFGEFRNEAQSGGGGHADGAKQDGGFYDSSSARFERKGDGSEREARDEARLRGSECGCGSVSDGGVSDTSGARRETCPNGQSGGVQSLVAGEEECGIEFADNGPGLYDDAGHDRLEVEPGLFPLADGVSGGVVVECSGGNGARECRFVSRRAALFGAGNAIVPSVAAEFVQAFGEAVS